MALPDLGAGTALHQALSDCDQGHLSYLLGAGSSAASGLPNWTTLLTRLLERRRFTPEAISTLLTGQDNTLVAEAAFSPRTSKAQRDLFIYQALYGTKQTEAAARNFSPGPLHLAVAADAVRRGANQTTLLTLNYDDLLEEALTSLHPAGPDTATTAAAAGVFPRASSHPRAKPDQHEVHHLHGLLPRESTKSDGDDLVLTLSDYNRVIDEDPSWQQAQLQHCLQQGPLLMVGTSYSDPDVRVWLHRIAKDTDEKRYLLLPRQSISMAPAMVKSLEKVIIQQWKTVGVECLLLDDFAETTQAIREMPHLTDERYRPPRYRVADIFATREAIFDQAQEDDYRQLADQAEDQLYNVIGRPASLTLWLFDADTRLVRWASNDRVYRDADSLRRVDPRLESSWIVSQALGFGDRRIQDISVESNTSGSSERTGRWRSVLAQPLTAALPGGPPVTVGVLSSASIRTTKDIDIGLWATTMENLANAWETHFHDAHPH